MNKLMEIVHPGEDHLLNFFEGSESVSLSDEEDHVLEFDEEDHYLGLEEGSESVALFETCHKCMQSVSRRDYYKCIRKGCDEYYLHQECTELKDLPQKHHPLHPQHPLAVHDYPCDKSFVCSFCGETKQSWLFYQCSDDQCDFYLDTTCVDDFIKRPELLHKYEIQHVLHHHDRLSPFTIPRPPGHLFDYSTTCALCGDLIFRGLHDIDGFTQESGFCYKCIACPFYLHTECSQVPKEVVQHPSHPHHPLVLLQNPPPPAAHDHHHSYDELRCAACLKWMKAEFYLHCNHCPTFNLDLHCYFQLLKPTFKHEAHEHPLGYIWKIYDDDVRCYACNTPFTSTYNSFRCFSCNFNIHFGCLALPNTVNYDDHVDPLTLTTSFMKHGDPTTYYCDICEKRRDPDHGIYFCKECTFIAHFECALSLSNTEKEAHADAPWRQKIIEEDNHRTDEEEDMTLTNEKVSLEIFDQLNVEVEKLGEVIQQLIKKREGEQLAEKIQEFDERHTKTENMLRRLKQSVKGTK